MREMFLVLESLRNFEREEGCWDVWIGEICVVCVWVCFGVGLICEEDDVGFGKFEKF